MNVLFITWDGSAGPTYMESLFMPALAGVQNSGTAFHVQQFTWAADQEVEQVARAATRMGLKYSRRRIAHQTSAIRSVRVLLAGTASIVAYARLNNIGVLMPRSSIPAAMALLALPFLPGCKLVFDADGLKADERVDFGGWRRTGVAYRALTWIDRRTVRRASAVVVRTLRAREILLERAKGGVARDRIHVIPNGRDGAVFRPGSEAERQATRAELAVPADAPLFVYAGSVGPQYAPAEMLAFFRAALQRDESSRLLVLTGDEATIRRLAAEQNVPGAALTVRRVAPSAVGAFLAAADLGLALRLPAFSQQAVSPIKIGEYLLCGLPVLATAGVGDVEAQIGPAVGLMLPDTSPMALHSAVDWFFSEVRPARARFRESCRRQGADVFGLDKCVRLYRRVFDDLAGDRRVAPAR